LVEIPGRCSAPTSARREAASGSASERERFGVEITGQVFRANERAPGGSERERQRARAVRARIHRAGFPHRRAQAGIQRERASASASGSLVCHRVGIRCGHCWYPPGRAIQSSSRAHRSPPLAIESIKYSIHAARPVPRRGEAARRCQKASRSRRRFLRESGEFSAGSGQRFSENRQDHDAFFIAFPSGTEIAITPFLLPFLPSQKLPRKKPCQRETFAGTVFS